MTRSRPLITGSRTPSAGVSAPAAPFRYVLPDNRPVSSARLTLGLQILLDLGSQFDVQQRDPSFIVGLDLKTDRGPPDADVRVMVQLLGDGRYVVDELDFVHELFEL